MRDNLYFRQFLAGTPQQHDVLLDSIRTRKKFLGAKIDFGFWNSEDAALPN